MMINNIDDDEMLDDFEGSSGEDSFDDSFDIEGSLDDFDGTKNNDLAALKEKPIFKVGIVFAIIAVLIVIFLLVQNRDDDVLSQSVRGSNLEGAPGTGEITADMKDRIEDADQTRREIAEAVNGSAIPTITEPAIGRVDILEDPVEDEDPLERWRRLQAERVERDAQRARLLNPDSPSEQNQGISEEQIGTMAENMAAQMEVILSGRREAVVGNVSITPKEYIDEIREQQFADLNLNLENTIDESIEEIIVPAGEVLYARLLSKASTDAPGNILAQVDSGPLRGSRLIGTFTEQNRLLSMTFSTIVIDGVSRPISAIALDPETTMPGMATHVDNRYLKRVILPTAAAFIEGFAEAIAERDNTNISIEGDTVTSETGDADTDEAIAQGVEQGAQEIGQIMDREAQQTRVLVEVDAGTPIGVFLLAPVTEDAQ